MSTFSSLSTRLLFDAPVLFSGLRTAMFFLNMLSALIQYVADDYCNRNTNLFKYQQGPAKGDNTWTIKFDRLSSPKLSLKKFSFEIQVCLSISGW